ncbi:MULTISPECIES: DUF721 domain-containing protein [unclassified Fibrobacter]|jgi:hypothetical protein|uniref:DUF721 domain-containing protein n=1 Tax=unclassified Fibrobacter TaxID=2634177 RepID=UPI0009106DB3|nr:MULTISPECIES: DUF721 domain-containing protein [unclassified Fibrobacter]SHK52480.1 Protein of unknown function [Fibrobacter sp. UWB12]SIO27426.1 Protein of unknown function [Fibrobacter sp. UWB11]
MSLTKRTSKEGYTGNKLQDISVLLERVLTKNHISEDIHFKTISERFSEVVGPLLVSHVKPTEIDKNTLVLDVPNSALKFELNIQKKAIIDKCNSLLGKPFIQGIRFAK